MTSNAKLRTIVLSAIATVLLGPAGCNRASEPKTAAATAAPAWKLDESKLAAPIRFGIADLDPAKGACTDFAGYANSRWLAANPIPGDKSSWGAFDVLELRSLGIQRQLAERAAGEAAPTGIEKIIADFWASGMDEARVNVEGLTPLRDRLAAIDALSDGPSVADYLRKVAAAGENSLFAFFPLADFKNSSMNMAYAMQGGLGLPDKTYYFDKDKKSIREAYEKHIAKVLELSGVPADEAGGQAKTVLAFETRLARASKSSEDMARDVSLYFNPDDAGRGGQADAEFLLDRILCGAGHQHSREVFAGHPGIPPGSQPDARRCPGRTMAKLPALPPRRRRVALPERRLHKRALRVSRQDAVGAEGTEPALEAGARRHRKRRGRSNGPALRRRRIPALFQGPDAGTRQQSS